MNRLVLFAALVFLALTVNAQPTNPAARLVVTEPSRLLTQHQKLDKIQQSLDRIEAALKTPAAPGTPVTPPAGPPAGPAPPTAPVSDQFKECAAKLGMDMMGLTFCLGGRALSDAERTYLREIKFPGAEPVVPQDASGAIDHESGSFDFWRPNSYRIFRSTGGASQKTLTIPLAFAGRIQIATGATTGNIANEVTMTVYESGRIVFSAVIPVSYADPAFAVEGGKTYLIRMEAPVPFAMTVRIEPRTW